MLPFRASLPPPALLPTSSTPFPPQTASQSQVIPSQTPHILSKTLKDFDYSLSVPLSEMEQQYEQLYNEAKQKVQHNPSMFSTIQNEQQPKYFDHLIVQNKSLLSAVGQIPVLVTGKGEFVQFFEYIRNKGEKIDFVCEQFYKFRTKYIEITRECKISELFLSSHCKIYIVQLHSVRFIPSLVREFEQQGLYNNSNGSIYILTLQLKKSDISELNQYQKQFQSRLYIQQLETGIHVLESKLKVINSLTKQKLSFVDTFKQQVEHARSNARIIDILHVYLKLQYQNSQEPVESVQILQLLRKIPEYNLLTSAEIQNAMRKFLKAETNQGSVQMIRLDLGAYQWEGSGRDLEEVLEGWQ